MAMKSKNGEKIHYVASTTFTLEKGYSDLKAIGKGSYGVVCSAFSASADRKVAIKKITPMAKQITDAKHVLREIRLMRHLGKHENVVTLLDLAVRETADELYIVMELLDSDLHRILQSKQALTENHYRHFFHQLLCGVKYLHDNRIIHRDLKPGNLLVTKDCKLRITDFGLARERPIGKGAHADEAIDEPMTEHVVTRWYRPPELMLCPDGLYDYAVDIWSCGCILAEMLGRNPLFPGKNFVHQLSLVFDVIGTPVASDVAHIVNHEAKKFLSSQSNKPRVPFQKIYPNASSDAWRLLDNLLVFNPDMRFTVDEALEANYLVGVGLEASLVYPPTSPEFEFSFEYNPNVTRYQLKHMIAAEVTSFKREQMLIKARGDYLSGGIADPQSRVAGVISSNVKDETDSETQGVEMTQKQQKALNRSNSSASIGQDQKNRSASAPRMRGSSGGTGSTSNLHSSHLIGGRAISKNANIASSTSTNEVAEEQSHKSSARVSMKPPLNTNNNGHTHTDSVPVVNRTHTSTQNHSNNGNSSGISSTTSTISDMNTTRSGFNGDHSSITSGIDSGLQTRDNSRYAANNNSNQEEKSDAYDQLFKSKPTSQNKLPAKMSAEEMIARITASKQKSAAVVAALDARDDELKGFTNVTLPGYQPQMKSPVKSMRTHSTEQQQHIHDEYLYKSMDHHPIKSSGTGNKNNNDDVLTSPSRNTSTKAHLLHQDSESSALFGSTTPDRVSSSSRRSIVDTYMSPKRLTVARREEDTFVPSITHTSPLTHQQKASRETSSPVRKPVPMYNSMMGGFGYDDVGTNKLHSVARPQDQEHNYSRGDVKPHVVASVAAAATTVQTKTVNVVSNSDSEDDENDGDNSSTDSSLDGRIEKVHIHSADHKGPVSRNYVSASQKHQDATNANYEHHREYNSKFTVDDNHNATHVVSSTHVTSQPLRQREDNSEHKGDHEAVMHTTANANQQASKKKITVAKSPKFSKMSWQRNRDGVDNPPPPVVQPQDKRSHSALRHRSDRHVDDEDNGRGVREKPTAAPTAAPLPSYMNATGSYLNKTNTVRSASTSRTRR